ncbi:hypothetical protein CLIM01_14519 [Colletotrichum limetticola]|uniref:Uncharacterized protein n=1 Tax=Colletotrichum limetticola TaxID=1209924 RepID=A0ABQ9P903_9PEZI|nr:hypothetical protein CLIM01_14519 [Colletotrichum limetticola]
MALPAVDMMRVSVNEVAVMNDAELAQFMQQHRLPDGNYDLPVDGWDELSREDRSLFAERLEAQKRSLAQSPTACSRPLALDDLDARLHRYWWLDKYTSDIKCFEPEHDKLWQELVEKRVLKPHETREFVRTDASGMEREKEKDQARKAYERAESEAKQIYVLTQEDPKRLRIPKQKRISMMKYGTEKLLAARRRLEQARSESFLIVQFVRATSGYAGAKRDAARHRNLVQWVLEQVPLIEAETNPFTTNQSESDGRRTKRKLAIDEEPPERRARKRVMLDLRERRSANARLSSTATETQPEPSTATDQDTAPDTQLDILIASSLHKEDNVQAMPQGLRRSARIVARRSASSKALKPEFSQHISSLRSEARAARPSTKVSPAEDARAQLAKRQSRRNSQHGLSKVR